MLNRYQPNKNFHSLIQDTMDFRVKKTGSTLFVKWYGIAIISRYRKKNFRNETGLKSNCILEVCKHKIRYWFHPCLFWENVLSVIIMGTKPRFVVPRKNLTVVLFPKNLFVDILFFLIETRTTISYYMAIFKINVIPF